jgi:hypothetical protein
MADLAVIERALRNAHAAGDEEAARKLAAAYQAEKAKQVAPVEPVKPEPVDDPTEGMSDWDLRSAKYTQGALQSARGARQLYNKLTGDEETLARLNKEEEDIRKLEAPLAARDEGDYLKVAGNVLPAVAATALAARLIPAGVKNPKMLSKPVASALSALGINVGAGALSGAAVPLTREEEESGDRGTDAAIGAALGVLPAGAQLGYRGAKEVLRRATRDLPEEAVTKFVKGRLGAVSRTDAVEKLREIMGGKVGELKTAATSAYREAEQNPALRPVDLSGMREVLGGAADTITGDLTLRLNPQVAKVVGGISGKADEVVSFGDVREAQRILKGKMRKLDPSSEAYQAYSGTFDLLDEQLNKWASKADDMPQLRLGDEPASTLESQHLKMARDADEQYRKEVVPFLNRKKVLGQIYAGGEFPMGAESKLLHPAAGLEVRDLAQRVPGSESVLKKLYGANVLDQPSSTGMANALQKPAIDQILTNEERIIADKLVKALRNRGDDDLLSQLLPKAGRFERLRYGVDAADYVPKYSGIMPSVYGGVAAGQLGN